MQKVYALLLPCLLPMETACLFSILSIYFKLGKKKKKKKKKKEKKFVSITAFEKYFNKKKSFKKNRGVGEIVKAALGRCLLPLGI